MATFNELMATTRITVRSPDGRIVASLKSGSHLDIEFVRNSFKDFDEAALCEQLAQLLARSVTGREQARRTALSRAIGDEVESRPEWELDAGERKFRAACAEVVAAGKSMNGTVRVRRTGHNDWKLRVKPGCLTSMTEEKFLAELASAVRMTMAEHRRAVAMARREAFGEARLLGARRRVVEPRVVSRTHIPTHS